MRACIYFLSENLNSRQSIKLQRSFEKRIIQYLRITRREIQYFFINQVLYIFSIIPRTVNITDHGNTQPLTFQRLPRKLVPWTFSLPDCPRSQKPVNEAYRRERLLLYRLRSTRRHIRFTSVTSRRETLPYLPFRRFIRRWRVTSSSIRLAAAASAARVRAHHCAFEMPASTFRRPAGTRGSLFRGVSWSRDIARRSSIRPFVSSFIASPTCAL